jgi:general secretion pathway protein G
MMMRQMNEVRGKGKSQSGFTLVEVLMVVVILAIISSIAIPKVSASSDTARRNADIATAHQVKTALDRYQAENGVYPKTTEVTASDAANPGTITATALIPKYIGKLDSNTTQQQAATGKKGFGVATLGTNGVIPDTKTNLIMIYLTTDGSAAEVRAYDANLTGIVWTSAN